MNMDDFLNELGAIGAEASPNDVKCFLRASEKVAIDVDEKSARVDTQSRERAALKEKMDGNGEVRAEDNDVVPHGANPNALRDFIRKKTTIRDTTAILGGLPISLSSLRNQMDQPDFRIQLLKSRALLQLTHLERVRKLREENSLKLAALRDEARQSYKVDLNDPENREKLPEEVKQRIYGMYVNRTDLESRIQKIVETINLEQLQFKVWITNLAELTNTERTRLLVRQTDRSKPPAEKEQIDAKKDAALRARDEALRALGTQRALLNAQLLRAVPQERMSDRTWTEQTELWLEEARKGSTAANFILAERIDKIEEAVDEAVQKFKAADAAYKEAEKISSQFTAVLLNPTRDYAAYFKSIDFYMKKLDDLIGLEPLKTSISSDILTLVINPLRYGTEHFNIALLGHAGTGKTEVAQLIAPLYKLVGIVPNAGNLTDFESIAPNDLQSTFQAGTGVRTAGIVMRYAFGGAVFLDEAYGLGQASGNSQMGEGGGSGGGSGAEAVTQLVKSLDEFKGLVLFIVAGYEKKMQKYFFDKNSGLHSRFPARYVLDDYNASELFDIFMYSASPPRGRKVEVSDEAMRNKITKEIVPKPADLNFTLSADAATKLKAALYAMKEYDAAEESVARCSRVARANLVTKMRKKVNQITRAFNTGVINSQDVQMVQWFGDLLRIQDEVQENRGTSVVDFDPVGLFRGTNARGVKQLYGMCVRAWSVRSFSSDGDIEREFSADDVSDALYEFTRAMLGVSIDYVPRTDGKDDSEDFESNACDVSLDGEIEGEDASEQAVRDASAIAKQVRRGQNVEQPKRKGAPLAPGGSKKRKSAAFQKLRSVFEVEDSNQHFDDVLHSAHALNTLCHVLAAK